MDTNPPPTIRPMPSGMTPEVLASACGILAARMRMRVLHMAQRDGSEDAAITGPGVGIGYLLARELTTTLEWAGNVLDAAHKRLQAAETGLLANTPGGMMASVHKAMADNMDALAENGARYRATALEEAAAACDTRAAAYDLDNSQENAMAEECKAMAEVIRSLPGWEPPAQEQDFPF